MRLRHTCTLVLILSLITGSIFADARVRRVSVVKDQIVTVKTALGVATIIQVPDKPNSVVVGDMNAFKVEYLDTAITIKPLTTHAKSNLYIYTDYRRFNVQLVSGSEAAADYVVYLENPKSKLTEKKAPEQKEGIHWLKYPRVMTLDGLTFRVNKIGQNSDGLLLIDFTIKGVSSEKIEPSWFWLTQGGVGHTIHGLILSALTVTPKNQVNGMIEVLRSDLSENEPMRIEMRRKKLAFLTIQEVTRWPH